MPSIYQQVMIKVIPQGQAQERPIGEMRQALTLFLAAVSRDFEGKLKNATPTKTGRSRAGWSVSTSASGDADGVLYFTMRIQNPTPSISWIVHGVLSVLSRLSLKAAQLRIGLIVGQAGKDLAGAAADQIGETVSFSGFHFTIVAQSKDEIVLTVS